MPALSPSQPLHLSEVREYTLGYFETLRDKEGPYGCYRGGIRQRPDLYSACDIAISRKIMGEDLMSSLSDEERQEWVDHINSFADQMCGHPDGRYFDTRQLSALHANGMVIGALGVLGGRQKYPVKLYDEFNTAQKIVPWLENAIDWSSQWAASHLFWGGIHCFSMSKSCDPRWLETVFEWLDSNLDENTGWWRKGTPHANWAQPLGGGVHIQPIYQHHNHRFPYPERVIDSVLALQNKKGTWLSDPDTHYPADYLELDALYALNYMSSLTDGYRRSDIIDTVTTYGEVIKNWWRTRKQQIRELHPHLVLGIVGTIGLLNQMIPDEFPDDVVWTDIFSDRDFYQTDLVEVND